MNCVFVWLIAAGWPTGRIHSLFNFDVL